MRRVQVIYTVVKHDSDRAESFVQQHVTEVEQALAEEPMATPAWHHSSNGQYGTLVTVLQWEDGEAKLARKPD